MCLRDNFASKLVSTVVIALDFVPAEHDNYNAILEYTYTVSVVNQDGKEINSVKKSDEIGIKGISFKKAAERDYCGSEHNCLAIDTFGRDSSDAFDEATQAIYNIGISQDY